MSHTQIQCNRAASLSVRHAVTGKLTLMAGEFWFTSKLGSICDSDLAAFISASGDAFSLVLNQS